MHESKASYFKGLTNNRSSRFYIKIGEMSLRRGFSSKNGGKNGENASKTGNQKEVMMRRKNIKERCERNHFSKCPDLCKTYDAVQTAYAKAIQNRDDIVEFRCNVSFETQEGD